MFRAEIGEVVARARNGMYSVNVDLIELQSRVVNNITSLEEFPAGMEDSLDEVITDVIADMDLDDDDRIGVSITATDSNGHEYIIHVPLTRVANFNAALIMNTILNVLPSSLSIALTMRLRFSALVTPEAPAIDMMIEGRSSDFRFLHRVSKRSKRVVVIHPDDDPYKNKKDCMYQWIAMGLAFLRKNNACDTELLRNQLDFLNIDEMSYTRMVSGRRKFDVRSEKAEDLRILMGCAEETTALDILQAAELRFGCNFVLFNVQKGFKVFYPLPESLPIQNNYTGREVFGICESGDFSHVNFCSSPTSFITGAEAGRCCPNCFEIYTRSRVCSFDDCKRFLHCNCPHCHTCAGICGTCKTSSCGKFFIGDEEEMRYYGRRRTCVSCHAVLFSDRCAELHEEVCEKMRAIKCLDCGRHSHRGLKCDEVRCLMCSQKMKQVDMADHVCFIGREKLKKPSEKYWTYDFETCLDENKHHVIYLATAQPVFPVEMCADMRKYEYHNLPRFPNQPVFVFWGLEGVKSFFEFLKEEFVSGTTFFAHNAGKYDSIFVEKFMNEMHGELPQKLQRGTKIMQMHYASNDVLFKDSLCFIASSLRAMQKDFGIEELKKGHFPHKLMTTAFMSEAEALNFIIPKPPRDIWMEDVSTGKRGENELKELNEFLDEFYRTDEMWNIKEDCIAYCISDTVLLAEILKCFREQCNALAAQVVCAPEAKYSEFDVLQHVTLPSGVMNLFMSLCLEEKSMAVVDRFAALNRREAITWCVYECSRRRLSIQDMVIFPVVQGNVISGQVGNVWMWYVDCYTHGCDKCYSSHNRNYRLDRPFYKLSEEYSCQLATIREAARLFGAELVVMREHDWKKISKSTTFKTWFNRFQNQVEDVIPCDPRDSYKGGMTELYKVHYPGEFHIADYVSQYPTSMLGISFSPLTGEQRQWDLPVGRVEISMFPELHRLNTEKLGIVKCRILPPNQLYAPFLGYKVPSKLVPGGYECIYGLCRLCMIERCNHDCVHSDMERSFSGVWTISEIQYAMTIGYRVLNITEMWEYEGRSDQVFKGFIVPFIREKILSSRKGLVDANDRFTQKGTQIKEYLELLTGNEVTTDMFKDAPVLRQASKLMMNSIYGKFGQRAVWPSTSAFTESDEDVEKCTVLLRDQSLEIAGFELIPRQRSDGEEAEMIAIVNYQKSYPCSRGDAKKHDIIAAHITAYGRQMLNEIAQQLGKNLLYSDTDSLAHVKTEEKMYIDGYRIGDLELEVVDAVRFWANGRKSYMYVTSDGRLVVKQKGVSLKKSMEYEFSMEKMKDMILSTIEAVEELQEQGLSYTEALQHLHKMDKGDRPALAVDQRQFVTKRNGLSGEKITKVSKKYTTFLLEALKRRIIMEETMIDTLPFGWKR